MPLQACERGTAVRLRHVMSLLSLAQGLTVATLRPARRKAAAMCRRVETSGAKNGRRNGRVHKNYRQFSVLVKEMEMDRDGN